MSQFQYANNPSTTLSGSLVAGSTSLSVASGAAFPTQGKFTIIVDNEIMLVTGVAGLVWTVLRGQEGTSAAAHNSNAPVTGILTKASFLDAHHFDVRNYGAVGNGVTNDTAAIQAAITAAAGGGTVVLAPNATYLCGALTMPSANVTLRGGGKTTVLRYTGASAVKFIHATADHCRVENLTVEDNGISLTACVSMNLSGAAQIQEPIVRGVRAVCTNAGSRGITVGWSNGAVVEDCFAQNLATTVAEVNSYGIYIHSGTPNETTDAVVRNNRVDGWYYGISSDGTGTRPRLVIDGNVVKNAINVGIWGYHAVDGRIINNTVTSLNQGIFGDQPSIVAHNRVEGGTSIGIRLEQLQYGSVTDNTVEGAGVAGICIGGGSFHATVDGNSLVSNQIGILVDRFLTPITSTPYEINITNNYIRKSVLHGIQLMGIYRSCTVSGNVITDNNTSLVASGSGIRIEPDSGGQGCRDVFIRNNTIGNGISAPSGGGDPGDQRYGINILDLSARYVVVSGNVFSGNVTAGIANGALTIPTMDVLGNILQSVNTYTTPSLTRHGNNIGGSAAGMMLTTRGTAGSVAAGTTVDVVVTWPHGGFLDTNYNVALTGRSGTVASVAVWVKAKTATTITVSIRNASGAAGTIDFDLVGTAGLAI